MNTIGIEIDKLTLCLENRETGALINTWCSRITLDKVKGLKRKGWKFDWTKPFKDGLEVYQLNLAGDDEIQGLIAIELDKSNAAVHIEIVETAPHNFGSHGKYKGTGGHLFAIAVKLSMENGFGGFVYFTAKTKLIEHYIKALGATLVNATTGMMAIEEDAAARLYKSYFKE